ncbi:MAG TPA: glycine zipper 2TM domain-containing protein [Deltaproteobacteria bacterium]|nr:glycine zipper 2TM domain-containing protein [Deltaproteobacteria bacterium]
MQKYIGIRLIAGAVIIAFFCGCATDPYTGERKMSKSAAGATIGAAVGAAAGALSGKDSRQRRRNALIGAGVGALAGGGVGYYMDRQEEKLRMQLQNTGVSVTRDGDNIILNMPGNVTFNTDSADIRSNFYDVLNSVVLVLKEFDKTLIEIAGHTDSTGSDQYNQSLSERRSASVGQYFMAQGVDRMRVMTVGYGEMSPIADNATPEGRERNRRVELTLVPLTQG